MLKSLFPSRNKQRVAFRHQWKPYLLFLGKISFVYDTMLNRSGGPYLSTSQPKELRDKKNQLYNRLY